MILKYKFGEFSIDVFAVLKHEGGMGGGGGGGGRMTP